MFCKGCERSVELAVSEVPGVLSAKADVKAGSLIIQWTTDMIPDKDVELKVNSSGYKYLGLLSNLE